MQGRFTGRAICFGVNSTSPGRPARPQAALSACRCASFTLTVTDAEKPAIGGSLSVGQKF